VIGTAGRLRSLISSAATTRHGWFVMGPFTCRAG
jgi:hypothetical protein